MATKTAVKPAGKGRQVDDEEDKKSRAVTTVDRKGGPPAALAEEMQADAGKGVSNLQEDNLVPLIYILQSNSPQVKKKDPAYIEGAEEGSIWLRNSGEPIVDGEEGFLFQPCYFSKDWVEWIPRKQGGGMVARHSKCPEDAERMEDEENPSKVAFVRPNDHEVVETRYHMGFVFGRGNPQPYCIPLKSTGHSFSKAWMFLMNSAQLDNGAVAPSYAKLYRLRTRQRSNAAGTWYMFEAEDAGWIEDKDDYKRGKALHEAFAAGQKQADIEVDTGGISEGTKDENDTM